jgi:hypothetical protein
MIRAAIVTLAVLFVGPMLFGGTMIGFLVQPWAPWWFSGKPGAVTLANGETTIAEGPLPTDVVFPVDPSSLARGHGYVSDVQRYLLAVAAGWSREDAITATAISIAEDGSGDPAALSGLNWNKTRDLGLWQINSIHWDGCGGPTALTDPLTNARCAHGIFGASRNWCAWSTYTPCSTHPCGPPCYRDFLARARVAAVTPLPAGQA